MNAHFDIVTSCKLIVAYFFRLYMKQKSDLELVKMQKTIAVVTCFMSTDNIVIVFGLQKDPNVTFLQSSRSWKKTHLNTKNIAKNTQLTSIFLEPYSIVFLTHYIVMRFEHAFLRFSDIMNCFDKFKLKSILNLFVGFNSDLYLATDNWQEVCCC